MISRTYAIGLAVAFFLLLVLVLARFSVAAPEPRVVTAIRQEFGTGWLGGCFAHIAWRESRYNPRAANWTDRHSDGSVGSWGALGIGSLWRRPGETVDHFRIRMFDPRENAALAHSIYRRYGLAPWGNPC